MLKFLIAVDNSEQSLRAVEHVIRLTQCPEAPKLFVLNVREWSDAWEVLRFLNKDEIQRVQQSEGKADLQRARDLLDRAGIAHEAHVIAGPIAETIADFAQRQGCDQIFMGSRGRGGLGGLLLGSVATKVIHLARVPVTIVK